MIRAQTGIDMFAKDVKIWTASPNHGFFSIEESIKIFCATISNIIRGFKIENEILHRIVYCTPETNWNINKSIFVGTIHWHSLN